MTNKSRTLLEAQTERRRQKEKVHTPKLAHVLAERLRRTIVTGELPPGSTLPSEAHLLEEYGISRPALREALRILESEDLIAISRGIRGGAVVLSPTIEKAAQFGRSYLVAQGTTLRELYEARTLLEPRVVAMLALQSRRDTAATLRACIQRAEVAIASGSPKMALICANEFHELLVQLSKNRALGFLIGILHGIAERSYSTLGEVDLDQDTKLKVINRSITSFHRLVDLIEAGDPDAAEVFWTDYMKKGGKVLASSGHMDDILSI